MADLYTADVQVAETGDVVVQVSGEIDIYTGPGLKLDLIDVLRTTQNGVVIDLSKVGFIDSTGLGVLLGVLRRLQEQKRSLALVITNASVFKVFTVTGLDKIFSVHQTRAKALDVVQRR